MTRFVNPQQFSSIAANNAQVCLMGKLTESNGTWKIGNIELNTGMQEIEQGDNQFAQAWVEKTSNTSAKLLKPVGVINCEEDSYDMETIGKYLGMVKQEF